MTYFQNGLHTHANLLLLFSILYRSRFTIHSVNKIREMLPALPVQYSRMQVIMGIWKRLCRMLFLSLSHRFICPSLLHSHSLRALVPRLFISTGKPSVFSNWSNAIQFNSFRFRIIIKFNVRTHNRCNYGLIRIYIWIITIWVFTLLNRFVCFTCFVMN